MKVLIYICTLFVLAAFALAQTPLYHFKFDGNVNDDSPNHSHGVYDYHSNPVENYKFIPDRFGNLFGSIMFEKNGVVQVSGQHLDDDTTLLSFWVKPNSILPSESTIQHEGIISAQDSISKYPQWAVHLEQTSDGNSIVFRTLLYVEPQIVQISIDTGWSHLVFEYIENQDTLGTIRGYVNGILMGSIDQVTTSYFRANRLLFGQSRLLSALDDLRIYNMIVTEEELEEISQAPQYVPPPTSVSEIDFSNQLLHIYPNPTSELVKINYTGAQTPDQIRIYDAMGTQVLTTGYSNTVLLKNLSNGTYFMYLFSENQNIAQQTLVILK